MLKLFSILALKLTGWKVNVDYDRSVKKYIAIGAPHTSNWDFIVAILALKRANMKLTILAKKSLFFFPLGYIMRALGAVPIDRSGGKNYVLEVVNQINLAEEIYIGVAPEGTRGSVFRWKTGFYRIAVEAKIPILICYIDFNLKEAGVKTLFYPTGDIEKDFEFIKSQYANVSPKRPEFWSLESITPFQIEK